jgi:hypothetical protein
VGRVRPSGEHDLALCIDDDRRLGAESRSGGGIGPIQAVLERPASHLRIREAVHSPRDLLHPLGALAQQDDDVAGGRPGDGEVDRAGPVRLDADGLSPACGNTPQDSPDDGSRILPARIVAGDGDRVGRAGRDRAHQRPLALVAIAAAAEDRVEAPAGRERARGGQRAVQALRRVGVVDDDPRLQIGWRRDDVEPAGRRDQARRRLEHLSGVGAERHDAGEGGQDVRHVEPAVERDAAGHRAVRQAVDDQAGPIGVGLDAVGPQAEHGAGGCVATRQSRVGQFIGDETHAGAEALTKVAEVGIVGVQDGDGPGAGGPGGEIAKQAALDRHVVANAAVVDDVIGTDVGEDRGIQIEAVVHVPAQAGGTQLDDEALDASPPAAGHERDELPQVLAGFDVPHTDPRGFRRGDGRAESARFHELGDELGGRGLALGAGDPDRPHAGQLPAHTRVGARQEGGVRRQPSSRHGGRLTLGLAATPSSGPNSVHPSRCHPCERRDPWPCRASWPSRPSSSSRSPYGCVSAGRFPRGGN